MEELDELRAIARAQAWQEAGPRLGYGNVRPTAQRVRAIPQLRKG